MQLTIRSRTLIVDECEEHGLGDSPALRRLCNVFGRCGWRVSATTKLLAYSATRPMS